jgi:hypothetical protein
VRKDGGDFAYMTGATISARAVVRATGRAVAAIAPLRERLFALPVGADASGIFTPKRDASTGRRAADMIMTRKVITGRSARP